MLWQTTSRGAKKIRQDLDGKYAYLGGGAFGRDKRGKMVADEADIASEMAAAGLSTAGGEYTAYVYYEIEVP
jgi:V-type H+-transporting ATPase subunit C